jgi:hypothetical protein
MDAEKIPTPEEVVIGKVGRLGAEKGVCNVRRVHNGG